MNLVLADRQWFKAEVGLGVRETPLEVSICRHVLLTPGLTVIPDMRADGRVGNNPLVAADGGLRFYAGHLLATPEGVPLGTLCILDRQPRPDLDPQERLALAALARQLASLLELRRALAAQRRLVEQKELLFQELNHRVANSLQMVASLIQLQSAVSIDASDVRTVLGDARNRVLTIAMLHEQLNRSGEVCTVELASYLCETVRSIAVAGAAVEAEVAAAQPLMLPTGQAVAAAMLVNELVTNAVKHARPAGVPLRVLVRVEASEDEAPAIIVADNGAGLPSEFDPGASSGLGMRIIMGLVGQLEGALSWETGPSGASFRLELPRDAARRGGPNR